jgi:prepilin-type N-terminal cleavage/methylation domain-containing protein
MLKPMCRSRHDSGFTLVESLVALTLLAIALLLGLGLMVQQPAVVRRVDAHRQALRAMEATLEALRAGALPLISTQVTASPALPAELPSGLAVWIEVAPIAPPGLHQVTVRARYPAAGRVVERRIETLVFRPPGGAAESP